MGVNKENYTEGWTEEEKKQGFKIIPISSNYDLEKRIDTLEKQHVNRVKEEAYYFKEQKQQIEELGEQLKVFGIEMDRIEEAYRKFVEENLDHVFEITEYADKRIKKIEEQIYKLEQKSPENLLHEIEKNNGKIKKLVNKLELDQILPYNWGEKN